MKSENVSRLMNVIADLMSIETLNVDEIIQQQQKMILSVNHSEVQFKLSYKDQKKRFAVYYDYLHEILLKYPFRLGNTYDEEKASLIKLTKHTQSIWFQAVNMFKIAKYPLSIFLSILCIEEAAKVSIARIQVLFNYVNEKYPISLPKNANRRKNPIYSHDSKHLMASLAGILVNARADKILGIDNINEFMNLVEKGELEKLRQSCLYTEIYNEEFKTPEDIHNKESAVFYICLAGEILGEVNIINFDEFIDDVDSFEKEYLLS